MKNIIVYGLTGRRGGIESFFLNYSNYMKEIHLDFIKVTPEELSYEKNLNGSHIYYAPMRRDNSSLRRTNIRKIFRSKNYDALWFNSNDLASIDVIREAKKRGIKCIGHAHNSRTDSLNRTIRHEINKRIISKDFDGKFACSESAAKWFYSNYRSSTIIYNAIDINKYLFNENERLKIRKKYNIPVNALVIGNIGRLEKQKNMEYLISVFEEYHKKNINSYLMIVGNGSLQESLKESVKEKKLTNNVIFTGEVPNTQDYLSTFDIFMMPSLYEGLPVTLVEAQASGLKCVIADNITREVNVSDNIKYLPIDINSRSLWIKNIIKSEDRVNEGKKLLGSNFDISKSADYLEKKILEVIN